MSGAEAQIIRTPISYSFAREKGVLAIPEEGSLVLGLRPDAALADILEARRVLPTPAVLRRLERTEFEKYLSDIYAMGDLASEDLSDSLEEESSLDSFIEGMPKTADLLDSTDDAPIIRLINGLIAQAVRLKASDIHLEPFESRLSVRTRVDGVMQEILSLNARLSSLLVSRIKVMARLDIAEKRIPQDGRISLSLGERTLDVRVSTLPSQHGERVVMRLLDKSQAQIGLADLGMESETQARMEALLEEPNGVILVTGPTGSGKTTTLYASLSRLNNATRNILTVEDPVEYALDGIGQTQVNAKVGMTFAAGLRAILRQDPDVVMVGEIRDPETVEVAVQASLTGHLVLSTVHTNSAIGAITRLRDMGVEPFLLSSTIKGILAQRLVRRLCPSCKREKTIAAAERKLSSGHLTEGEKVYEAVGCEACHHTGYSGRIGLYELVVINETLRRMIYNSASEQEMEAEAFRSAGSLFINGLKAVRDGGTSLEEVLRVCRHQEDADGGL
ncbi:type II secretion system ATPase GspE [Emcibacter sp.]|uniref:type II secretion system ATPase GspE n=1 Tax=Emcibacter sp. TaxID=1979954 RepID=UPI002AA60B04|nr:type II secretion system ATPase GspE [Emcibacter sp.]